MTRSLPNSAKMFVGAVTAVSLVPVISGGLRWQSHNLLPMLSLLAAAVLTSKLKVKLPGLTSTMSVNLPFLLLAVAKLNLFEASLVAIAAGLAQCLGGNHRPELVKVLFSVSNLVNAVAASFLVFHHVGFQLNMGNDVIWTAAAAAMYFLANTIPVATVIALSENQKASRVWSDFFLWTFPCYAVGTGVAAIVASVQTAAWIPMLPAAAVAYAVYRSYAMYASRMEASAPQHAMAAGAGR
jgi:hypothetical protein